MPWKPQAEGEVPTLGWYVIDWIAENLAAPDSAERAPMALTREQEDFVLRWYALDPVTCRFKYRRGLLGRPRGWGKSPILGGVAIVEGVADVVPAGWDADGQPVGMPWSRVRTPLVHIAAVSEDQTKNTWLAMLDMLEGPVVDNYRGLEPLDTMVNLPVGKILPITSSARSVKGARSIFAVLDQTEEWVPSNGGVRLAQTIRTNCSKVGGRTLESPNAFIPGEGSVAEESAAYAQAITEGRALNDGLLYDHREAPASTDIYDRESLVAGLRHAYGDSSDHPDGCVIHDPPCPPGWAPIEGNADMFLDPANDVQKLRSDFLNQITHASDSWVTRPEWNARAATSLDTPPAEPARGDTIVLGFDGSRKRARGVTDATALIACRVTDGYLWPLGVWEEPTGPASEAWRVPVDEVDAAVRAAFETFRVVGFYADPSKWEGFVAQWEARYGARLQVKGSRSNPIEWWMSGGGNRARVTKSLEAFRGALIDGELTHSGDVVLTRHVLNARRRTNPSGYGIYKQHPDSPDKIDAAVAAVLAWQARLDAVSAGLGQQRKTGMARRIY